MNSNFALTFDVEDWYHIPSVTGSPFSVYRNVNDFYSNWNSNFDYLTKPTIRLLSILKRYEIKATFFIVADVVRHYPKLVEEIYSHGHEVSCHGLDHSCIIHPKSKEPLVSAHNFRELTLHAKTILEECISDEIVGYRAPNAYFGEWMFEELIKIGYKYDSSIMSNSFLNKTDFKIDNISSKPYHPIWNSDFYEFPLAYLEVLGFKIPSSGGPWLRFLNGKIMLQGILQSLERGDTVFYLHPIDMSSVGFPNIGNKRPFYWLIKGKLIEKRLLFIIDELLKREVNFCTIKNCIKSYS